ALTTIIGSVGDDTITIGKANAGLTVTGGAGNDTFIVTAAKIVTDATPEHTTITDFSAGDSIKFAAAVVGYKHSAADTSSAGSLKLAIDAVLTAEDTAQTVYGFTYGGANYLFYNAANSSTSATTSDIVVKLSGNVDLDSISLNSDTGVTIA
ncbi:hypothetical protein CFT12S05168_09120, partial [Campylobacter fetus subsp. testudinum]